MKYINNILFQQRAQKYLSVTPRKHKFVSYSKAKTVLLLFESDHAEKNPLVRSIISSLQQDGKKVVAWGFVHKKLVETAIMPDFRILNQKQTDFLGKPLTSYMNELLNMEFDLLIDLTLKPVIPIEYFTMYARAFCKAGVKKNDLPMYDFLIDLESLAQHHESTDPTIDEMYLFNQIFFYLKSIQTND